MQRTSATNIFFCPRGAEKEIFVADVRCIHLAVDVIVKRDDLGVRRGDRRYQGVRSLVVRRAKGGQTQYAGSLNGGRRINRLDAGRRRKRGYRIRSEFRR